MLVARARLPVRGLAWRLRCLLPAEAAARPASSADGGAVWSPQALGGQAAPWEVDLGSSRGVLQLAGPDAPKLLQGLVTNDVLHLPVEPEQGKARQAAIAAAFLTNKGRIITEALVSVARDAQAAPHGGPDKLLIDMPLSLKDAVLRHLRLFKLRAKVTITDLSASTRVRVLLGPDAAEAAAGTAWAGAALSVTADPRLPSLLGVRAIIPTEAAVAAAATAPADAYEALRLLHGVPEGPDLVERLPSECNIDLLHGINFAKGCYLGQELTARTQFKGVVRKRLLPFFIGDVSQPQPVTSLRNTLPSPDASPLLAAPLRVGLPPSDPAVQPGAEVVDAASGKALGTVVTSAWPRANVGLALLRLEGALGEGAGGVQLVAAQPAAAKEGGEAAMGSGGGERVPLTVFTPLWWPALDLGTGKVPS